MATPSSLSATNMTEQEMVEMLKQEFPDDVNKYSLEQNIGFHQATEELVEGYVVTGTTEELRKK